jgi:hypothetical protein
MSGVDSRTRLAGIDAKVAAARRTRLLSSVTAVVAAVVVATVAIPAINRDQGSRPPTSKPTPSTPDPDRWLRSVPVRMDDTSLPTLKDNGVVFYTDAAGMDLLAERVGEWGATSLNFSVTPATLNLTYTAGCWMRKVGPDDGTRVATFVNGHRVPSWTNSCLPDRHGPLSGLDMLGEGSPAENSQRWAALGVRVGQPTEITMRLRGSPTGIAHSQLIAGVFTAPPVLRIHGNWWRTKWIHEGHEFSKIGVFSQFFTGSHWMLSDSPPPSPDPYFAWLITGRMHANGSVRLLPGDHGRMQGSNPGRGVSGLVGYGATPVQGVFRGTPWSSGELWLILYHQTR